MTVGCSNCRIKVIVGSLQVREGLAGRTLTTRLNVDRSAVGGCRGKRHTLDVAGLFGVVSCFGMSTGAVLGITRDGGRASVSSELRLVSYDGETCFRGVFGRVLSDTRVLIS